MVYQQGTEPQSSAYKAYMQQVCLFVGKLLATLPLL